VHRAQHIARYCCYFLNTYPHVHKWPRKTNKDEESPSREQNVSFYRPACSYNDMKCHLYVISMHTMHTMHHGMASDGAHSIISIVVGSCSNNTSSSGFISEILCTYSTIVYDQFINTATPSYSTKSTTYRW
jgi:hypothetical protein